VVLRHKYEGGGSLEGGFSPCARRGPLLACSVVVTSILSAETAWRIHDHAESALLIDGRDYFRAFYAAAAKARRSILLLGWQFDSDVELLRGDDVPRGLGPSDVELLSVLQRLCRHRADLDVRILAWDFSLVYALEREVLQKLHFETVMSERFLFQWDATVPIGGSHHQKVAIIDGEVAFLGSQDICHARWDDSTHRLDNEHRHSRGARHQPYHEVQVAVTGEPARSLVDLFVARWQCATGERLDRERLIARRGSVLGSLPVSLVMPPARLGLARTIPAVTGRPAVQEVAALFVGAIARAQHLVYLETQYLTSRAVCDALIDRMRDRSRPRLEVVILLPQKPERLREELTISVAQALSLRTLDAAAKVYGHALGVYNAVAGGDEDGAVYVYIHSKLAIVDDDVFVVGSANLTNRSMTIDSEIVAAYEASPNDDELRSAIRQARVRLLAEHLGLAPQPPAVAPQPPAEAPQPPAEAPRLPAEEDACSLAPCVGLVAKLDAVAASPEARLRKHDVSHAPLGLLARAVHGLTSDVLDPWDRDVAGHGRAGRPAA
jgi:phosphatidylserine/phosphatidylglycerophosphate/cardiolipin synthase-like enzyme